jgi:hypothetical protein
LGRLADLRELASPSAEALVGPAGDLRSRPTAEKSAALRLVAAWALARMQLHAVGPRTALARDLLVTEVDRAVLAVLADVSNRPGDHDQLQKILGIGAEAP